MYLHPFGLRPLRITDRPFIDGILCSKKTMLSAYSFVSHYIWRDIFHFHWGIIDNHLCLFAQYDNYIYMPLPPVPCNSYAIDIIARDEVPKQSQKILSAVFSIMDSFNKNRSVSRIENIDKYQTETFASIGYGIRPGEGEYVYLREDLTNLKGDSYKAKRALCNHFVKHYSFRYEPYQSSLASDCMELHNRWKEERREKRKDPFFGALLEDSSFAHKQAIKHYKSLHLTGRVVRINGRVEGYIFGLARGDIFYILMEVANPDIKGLAQFIFREFCREMDGYTYINALGDSGLENLRRVKLSYRPFKIIPSYIVYLPV